MEEFSVQLLVIGGGPGGYVAAMRAGQLGVDTILVEEAKLGGTCLNIGCIPSKALIHAASAFHEARTQEKTNAFGLTVSDPKIDLAQTLRWKDAMVGRLTGGVGSLLKRAKVRILSGRAELLDGKTCIVRLADQVMRLRARHVVLATGSKPAELEGLPFGGDVISSTEALSLDRIPRELVVIGAGYIGVELGTAFAKLGSIVSIVEVADRILPAWDADLTRPVAKRLAALGVNVMTGSTLLRISAENKVALVKRSGEAEPKALPFEKLLVATGRKVRTQGFRLETLDLAMEGPFIRIDERCATSMRNVWAVGDVTGGDMLAHRAMAQGMMVAEIIAGKRRIFDKVAIPAICFSDPEIVSVGLLPNQAKAAGHEVLTGRFPFTGNGKAMAENDDAGFVRVVARADDQSVLGVQAVGAHVSELSAAFALAIEMGATLEDVIATVHAHPTRGEAFQEAALGLTIH